VSTTVWSTAIIGGTITLAWVLFVVLSTRSETSCPDPSTASSSST
jgi:hypothetical protein